MFLDVQDTCVIAFEYKLVCYSTYPGNLQFLLNYFRIAFSNFLANKEMTFKKKP